jgi:hypothetical protein
MNKMVGALSLGAIFCACASVPRDMPVSPTKTSLPVAFQAPPLFSRSEISSYVWNPQVAHKPFPHLRLAIIPTQNTELLKSYLSRALAWISSREGPLTGELSSDTALAQVQEVFMDNFAAAANSLAGADLSADVDFYAAMPVLDGHGEENEIRLNLGVAFMTPDGKKIAEVKVRSSEAMSSTSCARYISLAHEEGFPASRTQCFERGFLVALSSVLDHLEFALRKSAALGLFQSQLYAKEAANSPITRDMFSGSSQPTVEKVLPKEPPGFNLNSDVDTPVYAESEAPDNFAMVVGIEKYQNVSNAQFASNDARAMRRHLLALGFPDKNIALLSGSEATKSGIEKYLASWLPDHVTRRSKVFFYFSGHGANDPISHEAYLIPWDGDPSFLSSTGYPLTRLYTTLNSIPAAQIVVVLDSCFSGEGPRSVMAKGLRPLVQKVNMGPAVLGDISALAAAGPDQVEGTLSEEGHGLLTYYFLKGLNKTRGVATLEKLYQYLDPRVQDVARNDGRVQTPQLLGKNIKVTLGLLGETLK